MSSSQLGFYLAVGLLLAVSPAMAQTYDVTDYLMLTPGQWKIEQGVDSCTGNTYVNGTLISTQSGYIIETSYDDYLGSWVKERASIYRVTAGSWIHVGWYEYSGSGQGYWWYEPELVVPRSLELNQPLTVTGRVTHNGQEGPYVATLLIVRDGLSVTTPGGTFDDCLKVKTSYSIGAEVPAAYHKLEASMDLWAPGFGSVNNWHTGIQESEGSVETGGSFRQVTDCGP